MKTSNTLIWVVFLGIVAAAAVLVLKDGSPQLGSVTVGNEYQATTTPSGTGEWTDQLIRKGWGSLGSVIITKAGDVEFVLYNATGTEVLTTGFGTVGQSSSTQQLARITRNLAAGTYVFDVEYTSGLVLDVTEGSLGTSTITFR